MSQHNPPVRPAPPSSSPLICCSSPKPSEPYSASISSVRRQQAVQSEPGGHSSLRLASTGTVHPASVAVQSSIPTIPCIIFNQLILPCYLFPMFACTEPRSANQNLSLQFTLGPVPLTPLFATHRSSTQATENPNTYRLVTCKSSICHSYENRRGVYQQFLFWNLLLVVLEKRRSDRKSVV